MALKTLEDVEAELQNDIKVKVAGVDADGVMRGKVMAKDKFLSAAESGFGFCRCVHATGVSFGDSTV
jgi:glutamine synthetase